MNTPEMKSAKIAICKAYNLIVDAYVDNASINKAFANLSDKIDTKIKLIYKTNLLTAEDLNALLCFSYNYGCRCLRKSREISRAAILNNLSF